VDGVADDAATFPPVRIGETAARGVRSRTDHNPAAAPAVLPTSAAIVAFLMRCDLLAVFENLI
jgi:hypothetical protein